MKIEQASRLEGISDLLKTRTRQNGEDRVAVFILLSNPNLRLQK